MNKQSLLTSAMTTALLILLSLGSITAQAKETLPMEPTRMEETLTSAPPIATEIIPTKQLTPKPIVTSPTPTVPPAPTEPPTVQPTVTPDYSGDPYEPDNFNLPMMYTGRVRRSFNPVDDIDYIALRIKPGRTIFKTDKLTGAADTEIAIYDKQTGAILVVNDDAGSGLASQIVFETDRTLEIVVEITNLSMGYGRDVAYDFYIISESEFTPTPSPQPTQTPSAQPTAAATYTPYPTYTPIPTPLATYTPYPTFTPYPTTKSTWPTAAPTQTPRIVVMVATPTVRIWPTATAPPPTPTPNWQATKAIQQAAWEVAQQATQAAVTARQSQGAAIVQAPQPTATPHVYSTLRIELFTDMDDDGVLDAGEGLDNLLVTVSDFINSFTASGYANNGLLLLPITNEATTLRVAVPYLGETQQVELKTTANSVQFTAPAPLLPIEFP